MRTFVQRVFLLACFSGGDAEVLEDFSPLSTNATYWKTRQDTLEGSKTPCPLRDACGGCAKGKYSQITGEEGMISATMDIRGGIRKRGFVHKIRKRSGFSKVKCILICILVGIIY